MSCNSYLNTINSQILAKNSEDEDNINNSIDYLGRHLRAWEGFDEVDDYFPFGSYVKNTCLPRCIDNSADVDYIVVFNSNKLTPQTYLNKVSRFIEAKYPRSQRYQSHPTIVLDMNNIKFEVMPAIHLWGYGNNYYNIPAPQTGAVVWTTTQPLELQRRLDAADELYDGMLRPVIRLIKYWNVRNGKILTSFRIEEYVISQAYLGCNNLFDFFSHAVRNLTHCEYLPDYKRRQLQSFVGLIANAVNFSNLNAEPAAEQILHNLIPEIK